MVLTRFVAAVVLGIAAGLAGWVGVLEAHPMFSFVSAAGLVPGLVSGLLGGFVASWVAPRRKILVAAALAVVAAAYLVAVSGTAGNTYGGHNPLLWYWPIWLVPAAVLGGYLSRNLWLPSNTSLERTRER